MKVYRAIAIAGLVVLSACQQQPNVCEGAEVKDGVVRGFGTDPSSPEYALIKNLQLKEIRVVKTDESTGATQCSARVIVPTDGGPLDAPLEFRVGPSASTGKSVFMHFTFSKAVEDMWAQLVVIAAKTATH